METTLPLLLIVEDDSSTRYILARIMGQKGWRVLAVPTVAGGMNAIQFHDDGTLTGAACWRADGTPIGLAGGLARAGIRFGLA